MMKLESNYLTFQQTLSNTEKKVVQFMIQNKEFTQQATISQLSQEVHTSKSFISKLIQKIGYTSFAELKLTLSNERKSLSIPKEHNDFIQLQQQDLLKTRKIIEQTNFKPIFELLDQTNIIYCYGTGHSIQNCMRELSRHLMSMCQKHVIYIVGQNELETMVDLITENDCFIVASFSGETTSLIQLIEQLSLKQIPMLNFSPFIDTRLSNLATYNLFYFSTPIINPIRDNQMVSFLPLYLCIDTLTKLYLEHLINKS